MRTPPGFQPGAPVLTRLQFQAGAWQGTTLTALAAQENNESGGSLVWAHTSFTSRTPNTAGRPHLRVQAGRKRKEPVVSADLP